jgi:hypothetical protein
VCCHGRTLNGTGVSTEAERPQQAQADARPAKCVQHAAKVR